MRPFRQRQFLGMQFKFQSIQFISFHNKDKGRNGKKATWCHLGRPASHCYMAHNNHEHRLSYIAYRIQDLRKTYREKIVQEEYKPEYNTAIALVEDYRDFELQCRDARVNKHWTHVKSLGKIHSSKAA